MNSKLILEHQDLFEHAAYIFDVDALTDHISDVRKRLNSNAKLCYAMKANPFLVKVLEPHIDTFEVCSFGEFHICEELGIDMSKIVLSGVFKGKSDIDKVVEKYGSTIMYTAESLRHWELLFAASQEFNATLNVYLRLSSGSQFGMSKADITSICENISKYPSLNIIGIHYFVGTQRKAVTKYERDFRKLNEFVFSLPNLDSSKLSLEYGPGLPIDYFEEDEKFEDVMTIALYEALEEQADILPVTVELGRYLVANCGYYVTRIEDIKHHRDLHIAIVSGGMHQVNYFGQSMAMKTPPFEHIETHVSQHDETGSWTLCGALCTTSDILVKNCELKNVTIGDFLIFDKVGAYSVTEGIALFLSRDLPQVYFYSEEKGLKKVRNSIETYPLNMAKEQ